MQVWLRQISVRMKSANRAFAEIVLNSEPNDDRYRGTPQRFLIDGAHSRTRV
jgi:hypothetical protein